MIEILILVVVAIAFWVASVFGGFVAWVFLMLVFAGLAAVAIALVSLCAGQLERRRIW